MTDGAPARRHGSPGRVPVLGPFNVGIDAALGVVLRVSVAAMLVIVVAQVFFRYVVNDALTWAEEAARYLLVLTTFLGASVAMRRSAHMVVGLFVERFAGGARRAVDLAVQAVSCIVYVVLVWHGGVLARANFDQFSPAMSIPVGVLYLMIPAAGTLLGLDALERIVLLLRPSSRTVAASR